MKLEARVVAGKTPGKNSGNGSATKRNQIRFVGLFTTIFVLIDWNVLNGTCISPQEKKLLWKQSRTTGYRIIPAHDSKKEMKKSIKFYKNYCWNKRDREVIRSISKAHPCYQAFIPENPENKDFNALQWRYASNSLPWVNGTISRYQVMSKFGGIIAFSMVKLWCMLSQEDRTTKKLLGFWIPNPNAETWNLCSASSSIYYKPR